MWTASLYIVLIEMSNGWRHIWWVGDPPLFWGYSDIMNTDECGCFEENIKVLVDDGPLHQPDPHKRLPTRKNIVRRARIYLFILSYMGWMISLGWGYVRPEKERHAGRQTLFLLWLFDALRWWVNLTLLNSHWPWCTAGIEGWYRRRWFWWGCVPEHSSLTINLDVSLLGLLPCDHNGEPVDSRYKPLDPGNLPLKDQTARDRINAVIWDNVSSILQSWSLINNLYSGSPEDISRRLE